MGKEHFPDLLREIPELGQRLVAIMSDRVRFITNVQQEHEKMTALAADRGRAEQQIRALAKFPDENPNPVLRVAKNGTVLYTNKAGTPLLKNSMGHAGGVIPDSWRSVIIKVSTTGSSREIDVNYGDILYTLSFVPVLEARYVNIYGTDIDLTEILYQSQ